ncbi:MAG: terminase small subunit [Candidatus Acidiferrales bacterium]
MGTGKLTPRQQRFVEEYLTDLCASQAALRAGYSEKTAKQIGSRLLTHVDVQAAIEKGKAELSERAGVSQEWVVEKLAENHSACMERTTAGLTHAPSAANKSLELLGKHVGMFQETKDAPAAVLIQVNIHPHGKAES